MLNIDTIMHEHNNRIRYNFVNISNYIIILTTIIVTVGFSLYVLPFIFLLFRIGYQLIKREGARLTNFFIVVDSWVTKGFIIIVDGKVHTCRAYLLR